jgi:purine-nucleoside/S-methyl-5'-thioadenosine phosphorylase / adenosine deaminase
MQYNDKAYPPLMQDGSVFTFEALGRFQNLAHGMSCRRAPDMGVPRGFTMGPDSAENGDQAARHRAIFCESLNIPISKTVWFEPSSAGPIQEVTAADHGKGGADWSTRIVNAGGLITGEVDVYLATILNDNVVVLIFDPRWYMSAIVSIDLESKDTGPLFDIVDMLVKKGSAKEELAAIVAPSLGPCCYQFPDPSLSGSHHRTNMWDTVRGALSNSGLKRDRILNPRVCTKCMPFEFFSKAVEGENAGANAVVMGAHNAGNFREALTRRRATAKRQEPSRADSDDDSSLTSEEKQLNKAIKCPYGHNKVYVRSVLDGRSRRSIPQVVLRCPIIAQVGLASQGRNIVGKKDVVKYCCGNFERCRAYQLYQEDLKAKGRL